MTDHKFTDDENVISILEFCVALHANANLTPENVKALLDLINRQKAEIERLESLCEKIGIANDAKFERICVLQEDLETAKSEAIKEFAKKIKTDAERICDDNYIEGALIKYVDTLVKEMTETK